MANIRPTLSRMFLCAALALGIGQAQSTLTQIRDTVSGPDGTPFNGTVVITWNGFTGPSGGTSAPLSTSAQVYNGSLSVLLVPTTTASAGTFYQVIYNGNSTANGWTETWQVPVSSAPLTLASVRTSSSLNPSSGGNTGGSGGSSGGGVQYAVLPIAISQVTSLSANLASINATIAALTAQVNTLAASGGGGAGTSAFFADAETLGGTPNGANSTFTINTAPLGASANIYRNGLLQSPGVDYSIAGTTVTFLPVSIPKTNDIVTAFYRVAGAGPAATFVDNEKPTGSIDGANSAFTLANAPTPALSLKLFKNGVLLNQGYDYTVSGSTVTFGSTAIPQAGDLLLASYRR